MFVFVFQIKSIRRNFYLHYPQYKYEFSGWWPNYKMLKPYITYIAKTADSHLYNSRSHPPYAIGLLVLYTHSAFRFHIYIRSIEEVCVFPSKECWLCQGRLVVIWGPRQFARPWGGYFLFRHYGVFECGEHHHATMWI